MAEEDERRRKIQSGWSAASFGFTNDLRDRCHPPNLFSLLISLQCLRAPVAPPPLSPPLMAFICFLIPLLFDLSIAFLPLGGGLLYSLFYPVGYIHYFTRWVIFIILPGGVGYIRYFTRWGGLYSLFYPGGWIIFIILPGGVGYIHYFTRWVILIIYCILHPVRKGLGWGGGKGEGRQGRRRRRARCE